MTIKTRQISVRFPYSGNPDESASRVLILADASICDQEKHWERGFHINYKVDQPINDCFSWNYGPEGELLSNIPTKFEPGLLDFRDESKILFSNGRHRTIWLFQNGVIPIPVFVRKRSLQQTKDLGFVIDVLADDHRITIPECIFIP